MIEAQIEPQIIQTKLASQGQQMSEQQMLLQNSTDMAHAGCGSEKATEILNGWEGYVLVTVCLQEMYKIFPTYPYKMSSGIWSASWGSASDLKI